MLTDKHHEAAGFLTPTSASAVGSALCDAIAGAQFNIKQIGHGWCVTLFDEKFRFLGYVPEPEIV